MADSFASLVAPLLAGHDLDHSQAREVMAYLTSGQATDAQIGGFATAMRIKGATATELAGFATVMRENALAPAEFPADVVDTCGTGGGAPSFNISTAAAFVAAAAGVRIAKHGNRGVTSPYGSADVLETLGVKLQTEWPVLLRMLSVVGLGFLYAPAHHPAMRYVGPARKQLGYRTVFNQLGPLANPANAKRQLVGVWDGKLAFPMAEALMKLGSERVLVAHGEDGLDEISPCAPTRFALVWDGELSEGILTPQGFGLPSVDAKMIKPGSTAEENAALMLEALTDVDSERCTAILGTAACAIWIAGLAETRRRAAELAREVVAGGKARAKLDQYIEESHKA